MSMTALPLDKERWMHCIERVLAELKQPPAFRPHRRDALTEGPAPVPSSPGRPAYRPV